MKLNGFHMEQAVKVMSKVIAWMELPKKYEGE